MPRKIVAAGLFAALVAGCGSPADRPSDEPAREEAAPAAAATVDDGRPVVLFLGTSLTAGYGLPADEAFPALIQARIDSAGLEYRVHNAGVSGETSAGGLARLDWLLDMPVAVLVLELGANDGLRGLDLDALRTNLRRIVERTRSRHPDAEIVVAGMEAPPNLGPRFTSEFREVFRALSRDYDAPLIPFLLEGVAAVPALNQSDGIHPTAEGHRIVADNVWAVLRPVLAP